MKRICLFILITAIFLQIGIFLSCTDDDDDNDDTTDDDAGSDDDATDDDVADDDATDDDSGDDDSDTWTDPASGLTWQVVPSSDTMGWDTAKTYCEGLALAGGGWHLPTISELRSLLRGCAGTVTGGDCSVTDDCLNYECWDAPCYSCAFGDGPNNGCYGPVELPDECQSTQYWSASPVADVNGYAWAVVFNNGLVFSSGSVGDQILGYARCVR